MKSKSLNITVELPNGLSVPVNVKVCPPQQNLEEIPEGEVTGDIIVAPPGTKKETASKATEATPQPNAANVK